MLDRLARELARPKDRSDERRGNPYSAYVLAGHQIAANRRANDVDAVTEYWYEADPDCDGG